jgi:hypothetical protein
MKRIILGCLMVWSCALMLCGQETISSSGGISQCSSMEISWTLGEALQTYGETSSGIYTMGYQQPNIVVKEIKEESSRTDWAKVYPNPVRDVLKIEFSDWLMGDEVMLELYGLKGDLLFRQSLEVRTSEQLELSNLSTGQYLLRIAQGGQSKHYSIIKINH